MAKKRYNFKKIFSVSLSGIVTAAIATSFMTSCSSQTISYEFDGQKFNSESDVQNYAKSNLTTQVAKDSSNSNYWLVNSNGVYQKYSDPYYLKQMISNGIQTIPVSSSLNMNNYISNSVDSINAIPNTLVGKLLSNNQNKNNDSNKLVTIYRGRNNKYYYTEQEAKESYLNIHNAYCFNNIYFPNKESLNVYLTNNFDETNNAFDFVDSQYKVLKAPNGYTSQPLQYSNDVAQNENNTQLKNEVNDFVNQNAKKVYGIKDSTGVYEFSNNDGDYELSKKLSIETTDPVIMYSNQGSGSYIVDTSVDDDYNFYGPYFYKGSADILNITDKSLWKEVDQSDRDVVNQNREDTLIQGFFGMLVKDIQEDGSIFGISQLKDQTDAYDSYMSTNYPSIWNNVLQTEKTLESGKRYNSFLKIPVMYTYILEQLVLYGANNKAITTTKNYFKAVCDLYDSVMRAMIPAELLKPSDGTADDSTLGNDGLLSFSKLFGFDIKGFDYNSDIDYYMDKIKLHYKNIIPLSSIAMLGFQNGSIFNGALKFSPSYLGSQVKNYDSSLNKYYEYVWDIFSCNTVDKIKNFYEQYKEDITMSLDDFVNFVEGYVQRNAIFYQSLQINFQDQVSQYVSDKSKKSSLSMLSNIDNLDLLLSRVGNSFPLFALFKNLTTFTPDSTVSVDNQSTISNLFYSLKPIDINSLKNISDYQGFVSSNISTNFYDVFNIIADTATGPFFIESLNAANAMINDSIAGKLLDIPIKAAKIISDFKDLKDDVKSIAKICETFANTASKILGMVSKLVTFFKVAGVVLDALQFLIDAFVPKYEPKSYIYKSDGVEYVWDGGLKSSVFFGLIEKDERTVDDMKILNPIKLNEPRASDFYYLNGKNYTPNLQDDDYLRNYAIALKNGEVESDNVKLLYTFDNNTHSPSKTIPTGLYQDTSSLANEVFNSAFVKNESTYVDPNIIYKYANGKTAVSTGSDSKDMLIQNLVDSIQPTKIAMLPNLDEYNYPVKRDDDLPDGSINTYVLPGTSYDMKSGREITYDQKDKDNKFKYIIVDPNQEASNSQSSDDSQSIDTEKELVDRFMNSFNVESKVVYEKETIGNDYFSDFSSQPNLFNIYKAETEIGESKYFLSIEDAFKWLLSNYQYKKVSSNKEITYYVYKGNQKFYSMEDFYKWISENTKELKG